MSRGLFTKSNYWKGGVFRQYPDTGYESLNEKIKELIEAMYGIEENVFPDFRLVYQCFLDKGDDNTTDEVLAGAKVEISEDRKYREEIISKEQYEELKKRLLEECPKEDCQCFNDKETCKQWLKWSECPLLQGWTKETSPDGKIIYKHRYPLLGEYLPEERKIVLYIINIEKNAGYEASGKNEDAFIACFISTYIHELFHAFFHYVTVKKNKNYNYIREIEEAITEFSTLVFLRKMAGQYNGIWNYILDWSKNEIAKKQKFVGDLPAYGFGRYLFDAIPENDAFAWINAYVKVLGDIDENALEVQEYKKLVRPMYPKGHEDVAKAILINILSGPSKPNELHFSDMKQVAAFLKGCDKKQSFKIIMPGSSLNGLRISYNDGSWGVWFGPAVFMDIYGMDDKGDITLI